MYRKKFGISDFVVVYFIKNNLSHLNFLLFLKHVTDDVTIYIEMGVDYRLSSSDSDDRKCKVGNMKKI